MKKLEDFLRTAPIHKVALVFFIIFSLITLLIGLLFSIETWRMNVLISVILGGLFALVKTLMLSGMRQSELFWNYAKVVESLISSANTKETLEDIHKKEFVDLRNKSMGGPHVDELNRLHTIMKIKYEYVPHQEKR